MQQIKPTIIITKFEHHNIHTVTFDNITHKEIQTHIEINGKFNQINCYIIHKIIETPKPKPINKNKNIFFDNINIFQNMLKYSAINLETIFYKFRNINKNVYNNIIKCKKNKTNLKFESRKNFKKNIFKSKNINYDIDHFNYNCFDNIKEYTPLTNKMINEYLEKVIIMYLNVDITKPIKQLLPYKHYNNNNSKLYSNFRLIITTKIFNCYPNSIYIKYIDTKYNIKYINKEYGDCQIKYNYL